MNTIIENDVLATKTDSYQQLETRIKTKQARFGVIGLGYVGLPLALTLNEAGFEVVDLSRRILTEGWSIHELGTARMGNDPKTSVLNQFQQSHDVKNLFVVDGSSHVSASCQNPTWTIMSLAWRSCDYLADQFKKGNL